MSRLILPLLLFFAIEAFAQSAVDSLRQLIRETNEPRARINLQNTLAFELFDFNLEESFQTSSRALVESRQNNYSSGEGWALVYQSIYFQYTGNPNKAISLLQDALKISNKLNEVKLKSVSLMYTGRLYRDIGFLDSAYRYFRLAETSQKQVPDFTSLWRIYSSITRYYLLIGEPDKALQISEIALEMVKLQHDKVFIPFALLDIGDCYRDMFAFKRAQEYYNEAFRLSNGANWLKADFMESTGQLYYLTGDFDKAFECFQYVINTYEVFDGRYALVSSIIKMGQIMVEKGLYNVAMEYYLKGLKLSQQAGYQLFEAEILYEISRLDYQVGQFDSAMETVKKAEKLFIQVRFPFGAGGCQSVKGIIWMSRNNFDSSFYFMDQGFQIRKQFNNKIGVSSSMINFGDLYLKFNQEGKALKYFLDGIKYDQEIGDFFGVCQYKSKIGMIYLSRGDYQLASSYLNEALGLAKQSSSLSWLGITYRNLAQLQERQGNFKEALRLRDQYEAVNDSVFSISAAQSLASYKTLYDVNQKDQQIEMLNVDRIIHEEQLKTRNTILYAVSIIVILLVLLILLFYRYSIRLRRLNKNVQETNEEIQTQSEELSESNTALVSLNRKLSISQDEIRNQTEELRISNETIAKINEGLERMVELRTTELRTAYQELDTFFYRSSHDFRRPLTTLMGLAEVAKLSVKDNNALELFEKVNVTAVNLDKMLMKLQSISDVGSHQLVFKEVFLKQLIEHAIEPHRELLQERQSKIQCDVKLDKPLISYPILVKIIIENLIENAVVFSNPQRPLISVKVYRNLSTVYIEVEDNGEGVRHDVGPHVFEMFFRGSERSTGNGLGLYICKKAGEKVLGKVSFQNNEGRPGTMFKVEIPDQG